MTHSTALALARAHIVWLAFGECRSPGWDGPPPSALEAVAAIDAELAASAAQPGTMQWREKCGEGVVPGICRKPGVASADAGRQPLEDAKRLVETLEYAVLSKVMGRGEGLEFARGKLLAALARPAPAETTAPVSAQGDEPAALEQLRIAVEDFDSLEETGPTTGAVIDAALRWRLAKPARAQVAQGDEVNARWQSIETAPKDRTLLLSWHRHNGYALVSYTSADEFLAQRELDTLPLTEAEIFAMDWFTDTGTRLEGSDVPEIWQSLSEPPDLDATRAQQGGQTP